MGIRSVLSSEVDLDALQQRMPPDLMAPGLTDDAPACPSKIST
jgi:hypothetical protein